MSHTVATGDEVAPASSFDGSVQPRAPLGLARGRL